MGPGISVALQLVIALLQNAGQISQLIAEATAAGSATLPADAWNVIVGADNTAESQLLKDIAAAQAAGK